MHGDEMHLLTACREAVRRQHELAAALAAHLRVPVGELFYRWATRQVGAQRGTLAGGDWRYFFHGLECDFAHNADGRLLRLDFGPGGRVDTFSGWGLSQFVLHSRAPWPTFIELKEYMTLGLPAPVSASGALARLWDLLDQVEALGWVGKAAPGLIRFEESHTQVNAEGIRLVTLPEGSPERLWFDVMVCHRLVITAAGYRVLGEEPPHNESVLNGTFAGDGSRNGAVG